MILRIAEEFDKGWFNEIVFGYLQIAMDNLKIPKLTQHDLLNEMYYALDQHTAMEAINYFRKL